MPNKKEHWHKCIALFTAFTLEHSARSAASVLPSEFCLRTVPLSNRRHSTMQLGTRHDARSSNSSRTQRLDTSWSAVHSSALTTAAAQLGDILGVVHGLHGEVTSLGSRVGELESAPARPTGATCQR